MSAWIINNYPWEQLGQRGKHRLTDFCNRVALISQLWTVEITFWIWYCFSPRYLRSHPFVLEKYRKQRKGKKNKGGLKFTLEISQINLPDSPNLQITRCLSNPFKTYPDNRKILDEIRKQPRNGRRIRGERRRKRSRRWRQRWRKCSCRPLKVRIIWLSGDEQSATASQRDDISTRL